MRLGVIDNRQLMLHANQIAELVDRVGTVPEVAEFPLAVKCGGIPDNVIMNVVTVDVGTFDTRALIMQILRQRFCDLRLKMRSIRRRRSWCCLRRSQFAQTDSGGGIFACAGALG